MKWCIFVNRRCYGDDCVGWIKDSCFIYSLLPNDYRDKQLQTEIDWSKYESLEGTGNNSPKETDGQMSFLDDIETLIVRVV